MALKLLNRSATVAFAPMAHVIATGTMAGSVDLSFSSSAALEIFRLDYTSSDLELPLLGSTPTSERFNSISWGVLGKDNRTYPYGIIAGGLVDGSVNLWNPAKLMSGKSSDADESLVARLQKHSGAVKGLEFNSHSPNLLASGAEDGEVYIWDISNPSSPTLYPALRGGGGPTGEISCLSWNHKVAHILASTGYSGKTVIWDLRKQKQVISFPDQGSRRRCSVLQWDPEEPTRLIVASDDDHYPALQVWDLRGATSPVREFSGHTKGVLAMAWCPHDSGLLLSSGKDNRTLCWDASAGEVLFELPSSDNWNFDLQWSLRARGVLSTSSFDGRVSIFNIESAGKDSVSDSGFGVELTGQPSLASTRAPKWLKRTAGVAFGFGGKLISFSTKKGATQSDIHCHGLVTEENLVSRSLSFETAVASGDKSILYSLCENKANASRVEEEKETWEFLKVMFEEDARRKLLIHLNFKTKPPASDQTSFADTEQTAEQAADEISEKLVISEQTKDSHDYYPPVEQKSIIGADDFFDNLQAPITPKVAEITPSDFTESLPAVESQVNSQVNGQINDKIYTEPENLTEEEIKVEENIQSSLVVGDYESAVEHCFTANRIADALILASVGGLELWNKAQTKYMQSSNRSYMKIVQAVITNNLEDLINSRPVLLWKETLALLCTYAQSDEWTLLCDKLGTKLEAACNYHAAILCFICAGNIEKSSEIWMQHIPSKEGAEIPVDALQDLMEKVIVLGIATGQRRVSATYAHLLSKYSSLLANQGQLETAMQYLSLIPSDQSSQDVLVMKDRIYHSGGALGAVEIPKFPFLVEELQNPSLPSTRPHSPAWKAIQPNANTWSQESAKPSPLSSSFQPTQKFTSSFDNYQQPSSNYASSYQQNLPKQPVQQQQVLQQQQVRAPVNQASLQQFTPQPQVSNIRPPVSSFQPQVSNFQPQVSNFQPQVSGFQPQVSKPQPPPQTFMPRPSNSFNQPQQPTFPTQPPMQSFARPTSSPSPSPSQFIPQAMAPLPQANFFQPPQTSSSVQAPVIAGSLSSPSPTSTFLPSYPSKQPTQFFPSPSPSPAIPQPRPQTQPQVFNPIPPSIIPPTSPSFSSPSPSPSPFLPQQPHQQPMSPQPPEEVAPAPSLPPSPPTVHTADTSKVSAELRPVVLSLTRLFNETSEAMGGARANPAKKREIEDNSRRLGGLFTRLNAGDVTGSVSSKLAQLCSYLDSGDYANALHLQVGLTTSDWDECSAWLTALKRMIKARQSFH